MALLERLAELPDLVIARVLAFFPLPFIDVIARSANPWSVRRRWLWWVPRWVSQWVPRWLARLVPLWVWSVLVVYPEGLEELVLNVEEIPPPPPAFSFPLGLRELLMWSCGIADITPYRFPAGLKELELPFNSFPIPEDYEWPQVEELIVSAAGENGERRDRDAQEMEILRRQLPKTRIRW